MSAPMMSPYFGTQIVESRNLPTGAIYVVGGGFMWARSVARLETRLAIADVRRDLRAGLAAHVARIEARWFGDPS